MEKAYWTKEVAEILGVQPVTIRAWALLFEEHGYRFYKDEKDRRGFTEKDIIVFRHYQELVKSKAMSQDSAIDAVIARHSQPVETSIAPGAIDIQNVITRYETRYQNLENKVDQLLELNKELVERLDRQDEFIEDTLKERDQKLTQVLRGLIESATSEHEQKQQNKWKFWKR